MYGFKQCALRPTQTININTFGFFSFLINLDPDLLTLCASGLQTAYDLCLTGLIGHTNRIFQMIQGKSKRNINQVRFIHNTQTLCKDDVFKVYFWINIRSTES